MEDRFVNESFSISIAKLRRFHKEEYILQISVDKECIKTTSVIKIMITMMEGTRVPIIQGFGADCDGNGNEERKRKVGP